MTRPRRVLRMFLFLSALVLTVASASACSGPNPFQAAKEAAANSTVPTTNPANPANTANTGGSGVAGNNFLPDKNLSDCVNTNEQPNCGSPAKGTKGMYFTFVALVLGLGFVMWRISVSVRQRDAVVNADPADDPADDPAVDPAADPAGQTNAH